MGMAGLDASICATNITGALCTPVQGQGTKKNFIAIARFFFCFLIGYGK
jgi:hypothetical protein